MSFDLNQLTNSWFADFNESKAYKVGKTFEDLMEQYGFKESEILRLAGNESTFGSSPRAIQAAQETILKSNYYGEPKSESLVKALSQKFADEGLDMSKLGVVVGNGLDNIIEHLARLFLDHKSSIIDFPPTFSFYKFAADNLGAQVINIPRRLQSFTKFDPALFEVRQGVIDIDAILRAKPCKIIFLCSPNNPTGEVLDFTEIETLAKELLKRNILLFIDHAYIHFADPKFDTKYLVERYPNLVVGYTFSKAYALAGFRVGYALMSKELQSKYFNIITPFTCSRPSIAAAKAALEDTEHLKKIIELNKNNKVYLYEELIKLGMEVYPSQANFILFKAAKPDSNNSANKVVEALTREGVIIRPIHSVCSHSLRVTIGNADENKRFIASLRKAIA
jgi:histidinol-phosphate aminotransferase